MFQDPAFACYAMHKQSIENFITVLSHALDPNDPVTQAILAEKVGLNINLLTSDEIKYIERSVSKLWTDQ